MLAAFLCTLSLCWASSASAGIYWGAPTVIDSTQLSGLSCPSESLCVGVDRSGDVLSSTDPTGGAAAWSKASVAGGESLSDVSCAPPSGAICVAVGEHAMYTSINPAGGALAWRQVSGALGAEEVDCPTTSLCVATDNDELLSSTDPAESSTAWRSSYIGRPLGAIACASEALCVADESLGGTIFKFTNPREDPGERSQQVLSATPLTAISCPASSFCVTVGDETVATSSDPASSSWTITAPVKALSHPAALDCASMQLCAAVGENGMAETAETPASSPSDWHSTEGIDGTKFLTTVACPNEALCLAGDEALMIGVRSHTLAVSVNEPKRGEVTSSPIACPFGCTYSGLVCPHNCPPDSPTNAFIPLRLAEVVCGADSIGLDPELCSREYPYENAVTLTATPSASTSVFTGWGGDCSGSGSCVVAMSEDRNISASFSAKLPGVPFAIGDLRQSSTRWREGRALPKLLAATARRDRTPLGTTFSMTLTRPATIELRFERAHAGLVLAGVCKPSARVAAHPHARRCQKLLAAGALRIGVPAGQDRIRFDGRISAHRRLTPGLYRVRIAARVGRHLLAPQHLRFTIVR
jgi:Divergent InlB B-repeat domain